MRFCNGTSPVETQGDVWTEMNSKTFFFGTRERVYANEKSVKELGLAYFHEEPYFVRPAVAKAP